jgi:hypothetical protein
MVFRIKQMLSGCFAKRKKNTNDSSKALDSTKCADSSLHTEKRSGSFLKNKQNEQQPSTTTAISTIEPGFPISEITVEGVGSLLKLSPQPLPDLSKRSVEELSVAAAGVGQAEQSEAVVAPLEESLKTHQQEEQPTRVSSSADEYSGCSSQDLGEDYEVLKQWLLDQAKLANLIELEEKASNRRFSWY